MATQEPKTKKRLPDFGKMSLEEIAEFWETHDSADYWGQMEDVTDQVHFKRPAEKIVSVRITEEDLGQLRRIAAEMGLGHTTLIRTWIKEKLREVAKSQ
jgi:predicted DNA binding CopG/RHH family protein